MLVFLWCVQVVIDEHQSQNQIKFIIIVSISLLFKRPFLSICLNHHAWTTNYVWTFFFWKLILMCKGVFANYKNSIV